jgi:hypothetical protein
MRLHSLAICLFGSLALTGCSLTPTAAPSPQSGLTIHGVAHGGQQAISGSHVYLYAAGTGGYGGASTSLLTSSVLTNNPGFSGQDTNNNYYVVTDSGGNFSIGSDYTCTTGQQVYIYLTGGDSGGGSNSAIGLLAALGSCPVAGNFATATPFVTINEVTTVATAYSIAGFATDATDATDVSSSGTTLAATGIQNAFAETANLVNISTGHALATTASGTGTVPLSLLNTLANMLSGCVNTAGPTSAGCSILFSNMKSAGATGTAATDTATAAIYLAHNPYPGTTQIANLCGLQTPTAPFTIPDLPCSSGNYPSDFILEIKFPAPNTLINALAIDNAGNIWTYSDPALGSVTVSLNKMTSTGASVSGFPVTIPAAPQSMAIDTSGNAWVTHASKIYEYTSSGSSATGSPFATGLTVSYLFAFDGTGDIWIDDINGSTPEVGELTSAGTAVTGSPFTGGGLNLPYRVAIDGSGNVWVTNSGSTTAGITELTNAGAPIAGSPFAFSGIPGCMAIDNANNVWLSTSSGLSELTNAGALVSGSPFAAGANPGQIAIDGFGNIWTANPTVSSTNGGSVTESNHAGVLLSESSGFGADNTISPSQLAIDASGNVWMSSTASVNGGGSPVYSELYIVEFVGAATPVVTPISANLASPYSAPASKP